MRRYLKMRVDRWFLIALVLLIAWPVGALIGAIYDTIRQIALGY